MVTTINLYLNTARFHRGNTARLPEEICMVMPPKAHSVAPDPNSRIANLQTPKEAGDGSCLHAPSQEAAESRHLNNDAFDNRRALIGVNQCAALVTLRTGG